MNLLDLVVKIGVDDKATSKVAAIGNSIKGGLGTAAKAGVVALGAALASAATGVVALGKAALESYSQYEQLVGGVDKLFQDASPKLQEYAANAYQTAGMSANQYMEQATSFSASLINSLGGDTQKAADMADVAMRAMSDNVNTFGSSMEDVQNAFQGFSKQNFTMLDNLKLGYGGTKEEMQRLISDANEYAASIGEASDLSIDSFADIVQAIELIQEKQHIAGTTAREAATTIEGSVNMAKAAWQNWVTELGKDNADMGKLTTQLVDSVTTAASNIVPRVAIILGTLLGSVSGIVAEVGPAAAQALQDTFMTAAQTFHDMLPQEAQSALDGVVETFQGSGLADAVGNALSGIAEFGAKAADGISQLMESFDETSAMEAAATVIDTVAGFIGHLADQAGEYLMPVLEAAGEALSAFFQAVADAQVWLEPLATFLGDVLVAALEVVVAAFTFAVDAVTLLVNAVTEFVNFLMGVPASVQSFVDQVGAFFGQLPGLIGGFLAGVIASIGAWVAGIVAQAVQAGSQFLSSVGSFFGQLPGQVGGFLSSVIGTVGGWVSSMGGKAAEAASTFGSNFINGLMGIVGQAQSAGSSIVQGLIDGIMGMIGAAGDAIGSVVDRIASFLPHSPAKRGPFSGKGWTPYSGRAIVHGLAEGIAELADEPADAMASVMEGISATQAVADAATVTVKGSGEMTEGESAVIRWLAENLPAIIAEFTPVMGESEFGRKARKAVAYA